MRPNTETFARLAGWYEAAGEEVAARHPLLLEDMARLGVSAAEVTSHPDYLAAVGEGE